MALTPAVAAALIKKGYTVNVEDSAGLGAKFRNEDYASVGANVVDKSKAYGSGTCLACHLVFLIIQLDFFMYVFFFFT